MREKLLDTYIGVADYAYRNSITLEEAADIIIKFLNVSEVECYKPVCYGTYYIHITGEGIALPVFTVPDDHFRVDIYDYYPVTKSHVIRDRGNFIVVETELLYSTPAEEPLKELSDQAQELNIGYSSQEHTAEEYINKLSEEPINDHKASLLDQFAMAALPAVFKDSQRGTPYTDVARLAYDMAEYMLAESEKRNG